MNKRIADLLMLDSLRKVRVNYSKEAEVEARQMLEQYRQEYGVIEQRGYMEHFVGILRRKDILGEKGVRD